MEIVYLSLGSNQGDRIGCLQKTVEAINLLVGSILEQSSYFETEPWGFDTDTFFINQVVVIETSLAPYQLLEKIHEIEKNLGRTRIESNHRYTNRCIDIDILFYGNRILTEKNLIIPHQFLHERKFVLEPLNQVAGNIIHPALECSIHDLLLNCEDRTQVRKYEVDEYLLQKV